jgi:hypothetical protein
MLVQYVANINEVLDRCKIDTVDGGEVEDDGFKTRLCFFKAIFVVFIAIIVPWPILDSQQ